MKPLIEAKQLSFGYSNQSPPLFEQVDLQVFSGEVVALVGKSGAGKSTLCHCLAGIIPHLIQGQISGQVWVDDLLTTDSNLPTLAQRVGAVFQDPDMQLFMPTVEDEVAFGLENLCLPPPEIGERIEQCLQLVGMSEQRLCHPHQLSGGEKQRVALAAVLAMNPQALILDEAFSQLDRTGRDALKQIMWQLRDAGKAIVMVEHDWSNLDVADRVLVLKERRLQPFRGEL